MIINNGSVGIGTTAPGMPLELYVADGSGLRLKNAGSADKRWDFALSGNDLRVNEVGISAVMTFKAGGNIGIGATNPQRKFVIADASGNGFEFSNSSGYSTLIAYNRTTSTYQDIILSEGTGKVGIGLTNPSGKLDVASRGITVGSMPVGSIIQVVNYILTSGFSTTNASDQDTGLKASITPTSSTSKILVLVSANARATNSGGNCYVNLKLVRGAYDTGLGLHNGYAVMGNYNASDIRGSVSYSYLDSPATTSSTQYVVTLNSNLASTVYINSTTSPSTITLMEIAQ
jgi:hypothetical protein